MSSRYVVYKRILAKICRRLKCTKMIVKSFMTFDLYFRDGPDIRFSIRYPAKSGHFSAILYPAGYRMFSNLLIFEELRCFNSLYNSIEYRSRSYIVIYSLEISGIRLDLRYLAPAGYPAGNPESGF